MKTLQQLEDATDDELRVMLAELCGWKAVWAHNWINGVRVAKEYTSVDELPNYPKDLNACFEVVDTKLNGTQYAMFAKHLGMAHPTFCISVLDNRDELEDGLWEMASLINADARLRTIALILTLQQP